MKSIFIQIPVYRDLELKKTVDDCINQASGDIALTFGIHNCYLEKEEVPNEYQETNYSKIKEVNSLAPQNIGLQLSRKIANSLYEGEDYYLQIDSHTRFMPDWDKYLVSVVEFYKKHGIAKPLVTQYPATYSYDDELRELYTPAREIENPDFYPTRIGFHENPSQFSLTRIPTQTAMAMTKGCIFTASVSGGFIFADGSFSQITPNPKIAFWGEEPLIAARSFTHGFDLVTPFRDVLWHLYASGREFKYVRRRHAWMDFPDLWRELDAMSKAEYFRIMTQREIGGYALGSERSLDEYEQFAGLDFRTGEVTQIDLRKLY